MDSSNGESHDRHGSGPAVLLIASSLRAMGGQAVMAEQLVENLRREGLPVGFLPINPEPPGILRLTERVKYVRTLVVSIFYIASLLKQVPRYDVIHVFSASHLSFIISQVPAIVIARLSKKKILLHYHSGECESHLRRWRIIISPFLRSVDAIVVPSAFLVEVFSRYGFEAREIPNVIDLSEFTYRSRPTLRPRILIARMLEPLYNIKCALRAFEVVKREQPGASLTILGTGSQEGELRRQVESSGIRDVSFRGRVERADMNEVYGSHDVFLNSSSIDNMPISILEAFSAGLPVVTTGAGGIPYLVKDGETGHVVPVGDHEALAGRVLEVLSNSPKTSALVEAARKKVEEYCWPVVRQEWRGLYSRLTER